MPIRAKSNACGYAARRTQPSAKTRQVPEFTILRVPSGSSIQAPLCRLAYELAALSGWPRYGLAFLLGVGAAAALPPVDLTPLLLVAFVGLLWLEEGSAGPGASFGFGYALCFCFFFVRLFLVAG